MKLNFEILEMNSEDDIDLTHSKPGTSTIEVRPTLDQLFQSILKAENVFYRSQQRDESELSDENKLGILRDLYEQSQSVFLTRYHQHIAPGNFTLKQQILFIFLEFCTLFDSDTKDYVISHYIGQIKRRIDPKSQKSTKNQRYLAMLKLREEGSYFSYEKMREREPALFDMMIGQYLDDTGKGVNLILKNVNF